MPRKRAQPFQACNFIKSDGRKCSKSAGWGTDHVGLGYCGFHEGTTKGPDFQSSEGTVYSKVAEYQTDPDILNFSYEIAVMRLTMDNLLREYSGNPRDLPMARALVDCTDRLIKSKERLMQVMISRQLIMTVSQADKLVRDMARIIKVVFDGIREKGTNPELETAYKGIVEGFKTLELPQAIKDERKEV